MVPKSFETLSQKYLNSLLCEDNLMLSDEEKLALKVDISEFQQIHSDKLEPKWYRLSRTHELLEKIFDSIGYLKLSAGLFYNFGKVYEELELRPKNVGLSLAIEYGNRMYQESGLDYTVVMSAYEVAEAYSSQHPERRR